MRSTFWIRALAVLGGFSLLAAVALGLYGLRALQRGFSTHESPSRLEETIAGALRRASVPARAKAVTNPVPRTSESLAAARAHWAGHCAPCHGNDGSGNSEMGKRLYPRAPDMRGSSTQGLSDGELYYTIRNGIRLSGMPAWGAADAGDRDEESWELVWFIRHLPQLTAQEISEMQALNPATPAERKEQEQDDEFLRGRPH